MAQLDDNNSDDKALKLSLLMAMENSATHDILETQDDYIPYPLFLFVFVFCIYCFYVFFNSFFTFLLDRLIDTHWLDSKTVVTTYKKDITQKSEFIPNSLVECCLQKDKKDEVTEFYAKHKKSIHLTMK